MSVEVGNAQTAAGDSVTIVSDTIGVKQGQYVLEATACCFRRRSKSISLVQLFHWLPRFQSWWGWFLVLGSSSPVLLMTMAKMKESIGILVSRLSLCTGYLLGEEGHRAGKGHSSQWGAAQSVKTGKSATCAQVRELILHPRGKQLEHEFLMVF